MRLFRPYIILIGMLILLIGQVTGQAIIISPKENSVSDLHRIAVTFAGKPGAPATLFVNNNQVSSAIIRLDGLLDFLNIEVPSGPVELRVEAEGAGGKNFVANRQIHITGTPEKLIPSEPSFELPADGMTRQIVKVEIQDEWGYQIDYLKLATVAITAGEIVDLDIDSISAGIQIPVSDGVAEFTIQSEENPTYAILEVEAGGTFLQIPVRYTTPMEPFILVGSISGSATNFQNFSNNTSHPDMEVMDEQGGALLNRKFINDGRSALYASGGLWDKYRLTASYDSDRDYYDQLFEDVDPDEPYPIYGDASSLTYDAQTRSKFFAKIEQNESFLLLGDYTTDFNSAEFSAYNRSFNGLLSKISNENHALAAFASLTDRTMSLDEIRGEGISGYYYLDNINITRFSEQIRIEVRDRYHSETVLESNDLVRFQDYDINYVDGTLMFKQPVSSRNPNGNPVYIVIFYEHRSEKKETLISGLRYDGSWANKVQFGSTLIMEEEAQSNYLLYGVDTKIPLFSWLALKGEYAESRSPTFTDQVQRGRAYKAELKLSPLDNLGFEGYYRNVDSSFVNHSQTGGKSELGSEKYGIKGLLRTQKYGQFSSEYYRQLNQLGSVNENRVQALKFLYENSFSQKGNFRLGYEDAERERQISNNSGGLTKRSKLIRGLLSYQLTNKISSTLEHDRNLEQNDQSKPTTSALGLNYEISKKLSMYLKYRLIEGESTSGQTVMGFDSKITENTDLTGKYEIGGSVGEGRNRASIGLKNRWNVTDDLTLNFAYENTATIDSLEIATPDHESLSMSFEYLPELAWKTTGKYEFRKDKSIHKQVFTFGTNFKLFHGLSAISKLNYYQDTNVDVKDKQRIRANYQIGLAYRPERSDYFNALAKLAYITDENSHVEPQIKLNRMIVSLHTYWQPLSWLEFGGRFATRQILDEEIGLFSDRVVTDLYALRTEFDHSLKWSSAIDMRYLYLRTTGEIKNSIAVEMNYLIIKNLQLGAGYFIRNYEDPDFSYFNYELHGFYFTAHIKLSEDIFNWR